MLWKVGVGGEIFPILWSHETVNIQILAGVLAVVLVLDVHQLIMEGLDTFGFLQITVRQEFVDLLVIHLWMGILGIFKSGRFRYFWDVNAVY